MEKVQGPFNFGLQAVELICLISTGREQMNFQVLSTLNPLIQIQVWILHLEITHIPEQTLDCLLLKGINQIPVQQVLWPPKHPSLSIVQNAVLKHQEKAVWIFTSILTLIVYTVVKRLQEKL